MRKIERISISAADRERLERLVRDRNTPQKVVWRARIVLLASDGLRAEAIAATVGKSLLTVRRWRRRYVAKGVDGLLKDATRPSRVKPLSPDKIKQVVHMTLHEKPPNATHWSVRSMAAVAGVSYSSVQRIWRATGSSRTWSKRSRSRVTKTSPPKWRTWSGSISIHPTRRWSCASTKRAKSKPSTALNRDCP